MKERPIIFSAPMVRAILSGVKTQTRRIIKPQPIDSADDPIGAIDVGVFHPTVIARGEEAPGPEQFGVYTVDGGRSWRCPYGKPGDRLWVRETWRVGAWDESTCVATDYKADGYCRREWLRVDDEDLFIRLRQQCIDDARAALGPADRYTWEPGRSPCRWRPSIHMPRWASRITLEITDVRVERLQDISEADAKAEGVSMPDGTPTPPDFWSYQQEFRLVWEQIHGGGSWEKNPWVWVISFNRLERTYGGT